jgi:hypothetical protein
MPYIWRPGFFKMDVELLKRRLTRAELTLGDVAQTIPQFIAHGAAPPLGFVSFDLDFYWSTMAAFRIFDQAPDRLLPRVFCYFDDCIGDDWELHSRFTGELLAIDDFNAQHVSRKVAPIYGLRNKRRRPAMWNDMMFVMHCFDHPRYNDHPSSEAGLAAPLVDERREPRLTPRLTPWTRSTRGRRGAPRRLLPARSGSRRNRWPIRSRPPWSASG